MHHVQAEVRADIKQLQEQVRTHARPTPPTLLQAAAGQLATAPPQEQGASSTGGLSLEMPAAAANETAAGESRAEEEPKGKRKARANANPPPKKAKQKAPKEKGGDDDDDALDLAAQRLLDDALAYGCSWATLPMAKQAFSVFPLYTDKLVRLLPMAWLAVCCMRPLCFVACLFNHARSHRSISCSSKTRVNATKSSRSRNTLSCQLVALHNVRSRRS